MKGLTLIEALVAMLLVASFAAALARSAAAMRENRSATERWTAATLLAERSLEEMLRDPARLAARDDRDRVETPVGRFSRRRLVDAGPRDNLWRLRAEARLESGGFAIALQTLRRRPWSDP